ncbi:MAG: PAC2 family protein [Acidimicrobiales bacterium]
MTLFERHTERVFDHPVLVVSLEGWVDAGLGAAGAIGALLEAGPTELLATFDGETLIDQRARRPVARIVNGVTEKLTWPTLELRSGRDLAGADMLYLVGPEPDFKWRSFVSAVVDLARSLGVRMCVGLGAFPAPAPHTRPVKLAATAPEQSGEISAGIGVVQGAIEVPAGVWGALELAFGAAGIPAVGLWARVPHYVTGMSFAPASVALVDGLMSIAGLTLDTTELRTSADASLRQVDELITKSQEHLELVKQLERNLDATEGNPLDLGKIPTADELGAELERYLRGERSDHGEHGDHGERSEDSPPEDDSGPTDLGNPSDEY